MRNVIKALIVLTIFIIFNPFQLIYAETEEEFMNNLVGPIEQYNSMLSPVYLRNNTTEESISPQSGDLTIAQTDYVLEGRNGLDLEIKRIYKSGISNVGEMKVKYVRGALVDYVQSDTSTTSFYEERYDLGIGMRFSFPAIEIKKNNDGSSYKFLHTESGDVYRLKSTYIHDIFSYVPEGQTVLDVVVTESQEFSNGQENGKSKYVLSRKDGKKTYFTEDGRAIGIVDRYGNTIKFEYTTINYSIDGVNKSKTLISKIIDSVGREVTIEYKEDYTFKVGQIDNAEYSKEESFKYSQNPNSTDSGDLKEKFQVIINLPDNKKIVYDKSAVLVSNSKHVIRTRIQRVFDVDGKPKYHYWYEQPDLGFTYTNGTKYSVYNRYENLVQIDYCKTNRIKRYTYDSCTRGLSDDGSMQYRKIFEKQELSKTGFDSSKEKFLEKYIYDVKDKVNYSYTNEADGFGYSGYNDLNNDGLKNTYRYYTEKKDISGTIVKYTYDGLHELVDIEESGSNYKEVTLTEHDEMKLPKKKEVLIYNVVNGVVTGEPVRKIENYVYDEYGNLTNYTDPQASRDENGYPIDLEHTVRYVYDTPTPPYDKPKYHVPTSKTWNQDKDTKCQIIYTVDEKGNIVKEKKINSDGVDKWIVTDYQYDNYGNMTQKTVHSIDNTYVIKYEYGVDADGVDHKGAYLTKQESIKGNTSIENKTVYDFNTGNAKAKIDENGNRTNYEYDILGRLNKVINPDNTTKQYEYKEYAYQDKQIEYTDPQNNKFLYEYDILGNKTKGSVYENNKWNLLKSYEYDFRGNKIKEKDANGHSIRFEYDSAGRLIKKEYYENDISRKESISLQYTVGYDEQTPLLVEMTDEEGYKSKFYYDILNRLIKHESTPDKMNYDGTLYKYDYTGNKVEETDPKGNSTKYKYDNFGRLIKKTDAGLNETIYTYNSLNNVLKVEEPNGKITENIYNELGRLELQKTYKKGSNNYTYKKYTYDTAGNLLTLTAGKVVDSKDEISSLIEYTYNSMNRISNEYRKIDESSKSHTKYNYDNNGNRTEKKEYTNSQETGYVKYTYTYDYSGAVKSEEGRYTEPDAQGVLVNHGHYLKKYTRDYAGNMKKQEIYKGTS